MKKTFITTYAGGLAELPEVTIVTLEINFDTRQVVFNNPRKKASLNFEDIVEVSHDEKTSRSGGKAAAGAIIGGVLTGGIGLLAGAAIGGKKNDKSLLYITYKKGDKLFDVTLKSGKKSMDIYAAISSAIATEEPAEFEREKLLQQQADKPVEQLPAGCVVTLILVLTILITWLIVR